LIGAAVAAGIAAVCIGLLINSAAASGSAVASAAPMAACNVNPLYSPFVNEGANILH